MTSPSSLSQQAEKTPTIIQSQANNSIEKRAQCFEGLASQQSWPKTKKKKTEKEPQNNNDPDFLKQRRDGGEENEGEMVVGFRAWKP